MRPLSDGGFLMAATAALSCISPTAEHWHYVILISKYGASMHLENDLFFNRQCYEASNSTAAMLILRFSNLPQISQIFVS
jgi:hypothetical protein